MSDKPYVIVGVYQFPGTIVDAHDRLVQLKRHLKDTEKEIDALESYMGTIVPKGMVVDGIRHTERSRETPAYKALVDWLIETYVPADKQKEVRASIKASAKRSTWSEFSHDEEALE